MFFNFLHGQFRRMRSPETECRASVNRKLQPPALSVYVKYAFTRYFLKLSRNLREHSVTYMNAE